jgi:hypothetical protein
MIINIPSSISLASGSGAFLVICAFKEVHQLYLSAPLEGLQRLELCDCFLAQLLSAQLLGDP